MLVVDAVAARKTRRIGSLCALMFSFGWLGFAAAAHTPADSADSESSASAAVPAETAGEAVSDPVPPPPPRAETLKPKNYYKAPRSVGTKTESEPPDYVRSLDEIPYFDTPDDWFDVGVDYRMRYEYRHNDLRRNVPVLDEPFLLRNRVYLGFHDRFDPLRGFIEFEDASRHHSQFPEDNRDVNRTEIIQGAVELYYADAVNGDRPFRLQAGRMTFEYVDRRLIARNAWRNTTNNFQGFRAILGEQSDDWQLDLIAVQPIERLLTKPDRVDEERWFYGAIGDWRRWSDIVTLQPYYLGLEENGKGKAINRSIHTVGLRGYGVIPDSSWDYDLQQILQFGRQNSQQHFAIASTVEFGYTYDLPSKPRVSGFFGYASGDRSPNDAKSQRFDRLFGFARPWSSDDYITFDNLIAPKVRIDFRPHKLVRVDAGYSPYWLASRTDAWITTRLRDPTGQSGNFMGQELDVRMRLTVGDRTDVTLGYAHFLPGGFTRKTGKPWTSDFFYVELAPRLFK